MNADTPVWMFVYGNNQHTLDEYNTYTAVDNALKVVFMSSMATLQRAAKEDDKFWSEFTTALSEGQKKIDMIFCFGEDVGLSNSILGYAVIRPSLSIF